MIRPTLGRSGGCKDTYLLDKSTGRHYLLTRAEGIQYSSDNPLFPSANSTLHFKLYFPALPSSVTRVDMIEEETSSWNFYDIPIR